MMGRRTLLLGAGGLLALGAAADIVTFDFINQDILPAFAGGLPNEHFHSLAPQEPVVEMLDYPFEIRRDGHVCKAFARIEMRAVILGRRRYFFGPLSIAPIDMVVGWGPMGNPVVLRTVRIRIAGRDYEWEVRPPPRIRRQEVGLHCTNLHAIPGSHAVRNDILSVRRNHIVHLTGHLCDVITPDGELVEAVRPSLAGGDRRFVIIDEVRRLRSWQV